MHSKLKKKAVPTDATFVFIGTIKKLKASNMKQAPATDRTSIVTVNEIIEAPANLAAYVGQDITVELSHGPKANASDRMIFHAISWLFGENIAVRSLYEEVEPKASDASPDSAVRGGSESAARKHFHDVDVVVSGKVVEVRLPKSSLRSKRKTGSSPVTTRVSEHDPKWREAVIEVDRIHKGKPLTRKIVVRFPSSRDVAWRRAPKFQAGQEGYFMLHKEKRSVARTATDKSERSSSSAPAFTVRDPNDFQPYSEAGGMKSLIESGVFRNKE